MSMANHSSASAANNVREARRQQSDAKIEREISEAARRLGESIQKVVLDAKQVKQAKRRQSSGHAPNNWKDNLLKILGGADDVNGNDVNRPDGDDSNVDAGGDGIQAQVTRELQKSNANSKSDSNHPPSDVDKLLKNSHCNKFILRCMENELPPNLIHCMRLLRVLELKNSSSKTKSAASTSNASKGSDDKDGNLKDHEEEVKEEEEEKKVKAVSSQPNLKQLFQLAAMLCY